MVRLFRLMLFMMLAAVGVDSNELATLRDLQPPTIAPNVLHSVMAPPPIPDPFLSPPPVVPLAPKIVISDASL